MNSTIILRELRSNAPAASVLLAIVLAYVVIIVSMFDPALSESLNSLMDAMPQLYAAFGMNGAATTLTDFLLNYLQSFLLTLIPLVMIIMAINRSLVAPIDRGTMANTLASPISRLTIIASLAATLIGLMGAFWLITTLCEIISATLMFPGELDLAALLRANGGLLGLWIFMAGLCFASACYFKSSNAALWVGSGLCLGFYLLQMIGSVSEEARQWLDFTPFSLYDAYGLAAGEGSAMVATGGLAVVGVALFAVGMWAFCRRDLSV